MVTLSTNVVTYHPDYTEWMPKWIRQRDAVAGDDAIKAKGTTYLPKLTGQKLTDWGAADAPILVSYEAYKQRATFLNATGRTLNGLVGLVMRKKMTVKWPESDKKFLSRVGRDRESLSAVAQRTLDGTVGIGRTGHLVDLPISPTAASEPFISEYEAENIIDWEWDTLEGIRKVVMVKLREYFYTIELDGSRIKRQRIRVLRLGPYDGYEGDVYYQEVWKQESKEDSPASEKDGFVLEYVVVPTRVGGSVLGEIPFTFFNALSTKPSPEKPVLMDLVVVNLGHYRNSADLEHGAHFTALPQPWASGFDFKDNKLYIGSGAAWVTREMGAQAGYLEFTGAGLGFLKELMADKKKEMAAMGARLLEEQTPAGSAEATQTVKLRQSGERSVLARVSVSVSEGLSNDLRFCAWFKNNDAEDTVGVALNTDFGQEGLPGDTIRALMELVIEGQLSWSSLFWNMKLGEIIPEDISEEDEVKRIKAGTPIPRPTEVKQVATRASK